EIRELRENIKFAPASCRYKIYIIDEVHMLTREAFNALLKTLEEPPAHVIFIFATTETQKVPATILSRCQSFDFRRISLRQIADNLRKIAAAEGIKISDAGLAWIAEAGDGSLRDSQSIFDQVISYAGFEIEDRAVEEILGRTDRKFLLMLSEAVLARDAGRCLRIVDEAYYAGLDMKFFYQTLLGHFRNLLLTGISGGGEGDSLVDLPAEELAKLREQTAGASQETLQRYLEILMDEEENVRRSANARLNLEAILCRLAWLEPLIPIEAVLSRMEGLERRLGGGPAAGPGGGAVNQPGKGRQFNRGGAVPPQTGSQDGGLAPRMETRAGGMNGPAPAAERKVNAKPGGGDAAAGGNAEGGAPSLSEERAPYGGNGADSPNGGWEGYKAFLKRNDAALSAKIESGKCLACGEGLIRIGFPKGYIFLDDVVGRKAELCKHCRQFFGRETVVEIDTLSPEEVGPANNGNGNGRAAKNRMLQEVRREALSHPLVRKVLDVFPGAEVREVRLREMAAPGAAPAATPLPDEELSPSDNPPLPEDAAEQAADD
ncbi:MAG: DNA polymerase III subunit gamma/tau, partial [Proteobacteria bacterium]|nr:DNA polymerase III subunit gamma/tau [Pseudomonadota bacterium]